MTTSAFNLGDVLRLVFQTQPRSGIFGLFSPLHQNSSKFLRWH